MQSVADSLHANWQAPDQIAQAMQIILQSNEFKTGLGHEDEASGDGRRRRAARARRRLHAEARQHSTWTSTEEFISRLQAAGHRLFYWPAPNGYPDVMQAWASTGTMGMTLKLLPRLLEMHQGSGYDNTQPFLADVQGQTLAAFPNADDRTAANLDRLLVRSHPRLPAGADAHDRGRFPAPERGGGRSARYRHRRAPTIRASRNHTGVWNLNDLSQHYTIARLRTAIALILCSPEFLRR